MNSRNFSNFRCFMTGMVNYSLIIICVLFRSPCIPKAIQRLFVSWIPKAFPVGKDPASKPRQLESCCNAVHVEHRVMELGINSIQKVVWQSNGCRKAFGRGWSSIGLPTTHRHHDQRRREHSWCLHENHRQYCLSQIKQSINQSLLCAILVIHFQTDFQAVKLSSAAMLFASNSGDPFGFTGDEPHWEQRRTSVILGFERQRQSSN